MTSAYDIKNEELANETRALSAKMLEPVGEYQKTRRAPGKHHVYVIMAAYAFAAAVVILRLDRKDQKEMRDYFFNQFDKALESIQ